MKSLMYYKARTATDTVPRPPVSRLHRDPANEGPPLVKAFGNCQGGKLRYFPGDDGRTPLHQLKRERSVLLSVGAGPTLFDGNRGHEVTPFVESATSCSHVVNHGKHCGYHCEDLVSARRTCTVKSGSLRTCYPSICTSVCYTAWMTGTIMKFLVLTALP